MNFLINQADQVNSKFWDFLKHVATLESLNGFMGISRRHL